MFDLDKLRSSGKSRKRVGRGGSRGRTSGRGHKGQSARSGGNVTRGFEGGQMPLHRRLPKRGFNNYNFEKEFSIVNIQQLEHRFRDGDTVTVDSLISAGIVQPRSSSPDLNGKRIFVKVLGKGTLQKKLVVQAHAFSAQARTAIESVGGAAEVVEMQQRGGAKLTKEK